MDAKLGVTVFNSISKGVDALHIKAITFSFIIKYKCANSGDSFFFFFFTQYIEKTIAFTLEQCP